MGKREVLQRKYSELVRANEYDAAFKILDALIHGWVFLFTAVPADDLLRRVLADCGVIYGMPDSHIWMLSIDKPAYHEWKLV